MSLRIVLDTDSPEQIQQGLSNLKRVLAQAPKSPEVMIFDKEKRLIGLAVREA